MSGAYQRLWPKVFGSCYALPRTQLGARARRRRTIASAVSVAPRRILSALGIAHHGPVITSTAAVTCAVLAPAGPPRSRILAALSRDDRAPSLPNYNILTKMFLDHIIRPAEVKTFEETLRPHQLAKIAQSSNDRLASRLTADDDDTTMADVGVQVSTRTGPSTVLDRAVMEHNVLACSNIYNNITFAGLGALLDVTPGAAETITRKMIEQGRLRGWIDQVEKLIWFEGPREEDDAQGKAGGLGDVDQHVEETGAPYTKKWDHQIRTTAASVSRVETTMKQGIN